MEIKKNILEYIKNEINDFHTLVDIKYDKERNLNIIDYISIENYTFTPPKFIWKTAYLNLKSVIRESIIDDILESKTDNSFDVESIIYTEEQRKKLQELRTIPSRRAYDILNDIKCDYSKSFKVGDRVYYKKMKGIITYKHNENKYTDKQRWTITVGNIEYRYVYGTSLVIRKEEDLSHIEIDPVLNKLSTEKLLKIFRKTRVKGIGNIKIKRILQEREHIQTEKIIINV